MAIQISSPSSSLIFHPFPKNRDFPHSSIPPSLALRNEQGEEKASQKRFGTIAVEKGFITEDQLVHALTIQASENVKTGQHRLLGKILCDEGLITEAQIQQILETMSQRVEYMLSVGR